MTVDTSASPGALLRAIHQHRSLLYQINQREVVGRYKGSLLGIGWSLLNPLLMLAVFTFVFSVVFQARWGVGLPGQEESRGVFALVLFIGLMVHGLFAEILTRSPQLVTGNVNYVKSHFPARNPACICLVDGVVSFLRQPVGVAGGVCAAAGPAAANGNLFTLGYRTAFGLVIRGGFRAWHRWASFCATLRKPWGCWPPCCCFCRPFFSARTHACRLSQPLLLANPLTFIIQQARDVLIWGRQPDLAGLATYALVSLALLLAGFAWFQKTRKGFADVL